MSVWHSTVDGISTQQTKRQSTNHHVPNHMEMSIKELSLLLSMLAVSISDQASLNLMFQKSCDSTHDGPIYLGKHCPHEEEAQKSTAQLNTYKAMINAACVCIILLYAGAWSDSRGKQRKPLVIIPIIGQALSDIINFVLSQHWSTPSEWVAWNAGFLPGITGSRLLVITGCLCHISDTISVKTRTFRIGIIISIYFFTAPSGVALSGNLMVRHGFLPTFGLCIVFNTLALLIAWLLIPPTSKDSEILQIGFTRQIINNFTVLVRKRPNNNRLIVILCIFTSPLVRSPMIGEYSVLYLFVRYKFGWNEAQYGYYAAFKLGGIFFGTLISMGILSRTYGMSDSMIGILASISDMAAATCYVFVATSWQMFAIPFLDIFHGTAQVICVSIISKHVEPNEQGKVTSVKAFLESLTPFLVTPLYNQVYRHTFLKFPSAFFIISVVAGLPILVIFCIIRRAIQRNKVLSEVNNKTSDNGAKHQEDIHHPSGNMDIEYSK